MKKLYPNFYYKKVEEITIETLMRNKIKNNYRAKEEKNKNVY